MIGVLLLVGLLMLVIFWEVQRKSGHRWRQLRKFPGDTPLPVVGNALKLGFGIDEASQKLLDMWKRHGKTNFRVSVGSEDWVLLTEPDDVGVLFNDSTILSKSPERNAAVRPFFGESVSTSEGDRWRWARKVILSGFNAKCIGQRLDVVNTKSVQLFRILKEYENEDVPTYKYLRPYILDILFETLMGVESSFLENPDHPYLVQSGKIINMITESYFSYWRNIRPLFELTPMHRKMMTTIQVIQQTASDVMEKRKLKLQDKEKNITINNNVLTDEIKLRAEKNEISEGNILLDKFLLQKSPDGDSIPENIIKEELSFISFTGHFTTSVTLSHVLYCLAKNPDIQNKVLEEQKLILSEDLLKKPNMNDLNSMKYLDAVIKETLRVIPTVPKIGRKLKKDLHLKDHRIIPDGTTAIVYYEAMFTNDKVFPEPHKFNPDRFIDNNLHPRAFLPFGGGPRSCIGLRLAWMILKATLSNILRQFEILEGSAGTDPQFSYRIVTESRNGVSLKFRLR